MASGCDHIEHVRPQLPYAVLVGGVAVLVGTIPSGLGMSPWLCLIAGMILLAAILRFIGRKPDLATQSTD